MVSKKLSAAELRLGIADIVISLIPAGTDWEIKFNGAIQHFISQKKPDVVLKARYGPLPYSHSKEPIFNSGGNWVLFKEKDKVVFTLYSVATGPEPYALAILKSNFKSGEIYIRAQEPPYSFSESGNLFINPLKYPLDEVLMVSLLSQGRGLLTHASGISYKGKGLVFIGSSGAGKSTVANIWKRMKGAAILSDDRIIIRKIDSKFWIYGTPWHGDAKLCSPDKIPLEKIFFLKKAKENSLQGLSPIDAISRLMVCSFPTFWDKKGMEFTLGFCASLVENTPILEFSFLPDKSILDFIKDKI